MTIMTNKKINDLVEEKPKRKVVAISWLDNSHTYFGNQFRKDMTNIITTIGRMFDV